MTFTLWFVIVGVGIWNGIVYEYDCLIFTAWYVIITMCLFIPCWGIWLFIVLVIR